MRSRACFMNSDLINNELYKKPTQISVGFFVKTREFLCMCQKGAYRNRNFADGEYTHALRLTSKLIDLWARYANLILLRYACRAGSLCGCTWGGQIN